MILSQRITLFCTILASGVLVAGYAREGFWFPMILVFLTGLIWLAKQWDWLPWKIIGSIGLAVFTIAAMVLAFVGFPAILILLSLILTLIAWDLDDFLSRTMEAGYVENATGLERLHLKRIAITSGLGLILGGAALEVKIDLAFGWILLLVLVIIILLNRLMAALTGNSK